MHEMGIVLHLAKTLDETAEENKLTAMLMACNAANKQYRWIKFYISDNQDIMAEDDAILDMANVGEECIELVARMVRVVDEAYPSFMRAIYA